MTRSIKPISAFGQQNPRPAKMAGVAATAALRVKAASLANAVRSMGGAAEVRHIAVRLATSWQAHATTPSNRTRSLVRI